MEELRGRKVPQSLEAEQAVLGSMIIDPACIPVVLERLKGREDLRLDRIFVTHTCSDPALVEAAKEAVRECQDFGEILETKAGCTISCHCGPNTLGVLFLRK